MILFVSFAKISFAQLPIPYYANDNLPERSRVIAAGNVDEIGMDKMFKANKNGQTIVYRGNSLSGHPVTGVIKLDSVKNTAVLIPDANSHDTIPSSFVISVITSHASTHIPTIQPTTLDATPYSSSDTTGITQAGFTVTSTVVHPSTSIIVITTVNPAATVTTTTNSTTAGGATTTTTTTIPATVKSTTTVNPALIVTTVTNYTITNDTITTAIVDTTNDINACQYFSIFRSYNSLSDAKRITHFNLKTLFNFIYSQDGIVEAFQSASFQNVTSDVKIVNVQLASFIFGNSFRLGVGTSFNTSGNPATDSSLIKMADLQKIVSGGGLLNFNFSCPLLFHRSLNDNFHAGVSGLNIVSINPNFDSIGNNTIAAGFSNNFLFTDQIGFLFHLDVGSINASNVLARLSLDIPCTYTFGSPNTYQKLGIPDFSLINPRFGVVIGDIMSMHISWPALSTSKMIQRQPVILTLQFSPSKIASSASNSGS